MGGASSKSIIVPKSHSEVAGRDQNFISYLPSSHSLPSNSDPLQVNAGFREFSFRIPCSTFVNWVIRTESRFFFLSPESVFPKVKGTFISYLTSRLLAAATPTRGHPHSRGAQQLQRFQDIFPVIRVFVVFMLSSSRILCGRC